MDEFRDAIQAAGLQPPEVIEPGKLHRFPGIGKGNGNRAGWCKLFDDCRGGVFGDWAADLQETWQAKRDNPLSKKERAAFTREVKAAKAKAEAERKAAQAEAATKAAEIWEAAEPAPADHPYLVAKGIKLHGARLHDGRLVIPMRDGGKLHSLQFIDTDGGKQFLSGGRVTGCYFSIGKPDGTICIAEGFATAASIHEATGHAVAVAFNAGNLVPVAKTLRQRTPDSCIVICADNDESGVGQRKASEAAKAIKGVVAIPPVVGDWNDIMQAHGAEPVKDGIDAQPDGAKLLDDVRYFICRFCAFPSPACLDAVTLWVSHAHMIEYFHTSPRLALLSPEPESGKTRVLEVLDLLTPDAMLIFSPSVAAIFRKLAQDQVTLLFDECDTIFTKRGKDDQNEDLRALLNSGYRKGASIPRCVGKNHEVQDFKVFAACALAGIGELPDTIMTRSIIIRMRRRTASEKVEQFRTRMHEAPGHKLQDDLAAWAASIGAAAGRAWPELPEGVTDRKAEAWEPLIAVADQAGGHWPDTAREACNKLCQAAMDRKVSLGLRLLADLREIFQDADSLPTSTILERLTGDKPYKHDNESAPVHIADDAPWAELRGKPLDARGLARMLSKYDVKPTKIKQGDKPLQGYRRESLWDAWERYLSPAPAQAEPTEPTEPPAQPCGIQGDSQVPDKSPVPEPAPEAEPPKPAPNKESSEGSGSSGPAGERPGSARREVSI